MLRVVVAAVLAVALLGVAQPAIEDARATAAERAVERELVGVERAVVDLQSEEAVPYGESGARRVVALDLPERSFASAGIRYVAIGGVPGGDGRGNLLAYGVADRPPDASPLDANLRVERSRDGGRRLVEEPLVFRTGGRHRIALVPVRHDGHRVVVVRTLE